MPKSDRLTPLIPQRPENEKVWMVRSSAGYYLPHFKAAGIVAIGHLDVFNFANPSSTLAKGELDLEFVAGQLETKYERPKGTVSSHISQISQFCSDMNLGDIVVTVNSASVLVGRIAGFPYFDGSPVDLSNEDFQDDPLSYQLRRPVIWGPAISRATLPLPLERVFYSHRSVFEVTQYWDYIYHLLFPAFGYKNELHLSLRIRQQSDIRNVDIVALLSILQDFEELAASMSGGEPPDSLTVQAGFFSKGDIWPKLSAKEKKRLLYLIVAGFLLCGGEIAPLEAWGLKVGPFKFKGAIGASAEAITEILKSAKEIMDKRNGNTAIENLQLDVPSIDADMIRTPPTKPTNKQTILLVQTDGEQTVS